MALSDLKPRAMARRLVQTIRQEGWRVALTRSWAYLRREIRRGAPDSSARYLMAAWRDLSARAAFHAGPPAVPALAARRRRIAMVGDLFLPQCRKYRVVQPGEIWAGLDVEYGFAHRLDVPRAVNLMQQATHLMFYRTLTDPVAEMYLYEARRLGLPVLYDLDDPLFSVPAYETYANMTALPEAMKTHFLAEAPRYLGAMSQADIVSVSTPALAEHARLFLPRPVHVRRNFADAETLSAGAAARAAAGRGEGAPFRIAFASGSMGHEVDFAQIAGDLAAVLDAAPDRHLVILGHFDAGLLPDSLRGRIERHGFSSYEDYLRVLSTADCAVMPLTDDLFNRCKSAVRVIDAAAVAVPSLVGGVSDMAAMVRDGTTGRVLGPGDSWRDALEALARDRAAAAAMGQAARDDLEATWTARADQPVIDPELVAWVRG